jgi:surfeit locus 1 family protein
MLRFVVPLLFGLIGAAVLVSLGVWQLQRLTWKDGILSDIAARIEAAPVALPATPDPEADRYLPVRAEGAFTGQALRVLVSQKEIGAGYRIVEVFQTGGRKVLVDRGFVRVDAAVTLAAREAVVTGNLHWPDEVDSFTPVPDGELWFARDVPAMAQALGTEPVLIVARSDTGDAIVPLPVDTTNIPNNHFGYAIQWFGLAIVWLGMTGFYLWRIRRRTV